MELSTFNPSAVAVSNGNIFGLPFTQQSANIVIIPSVFDVTVSYKDGTSKAPEAIIKASTQLDFYDFDVKDAWKIGIYCLPIQQNWYLNNNNLRQQAKQYINFLETGADINQNPNQQNILEQLNIACQNHFEYIKEQALTLLQNNKIPIVLGGDHSSPLGLMHALANKHGNFSILQIDAHADLRESYEGFIYSHASIMYNALKIKEVERIVSVGVRDICDDEINLIESSQGRVIAYYDAWVKTRTHIERTETFASLAAEIVSMLGNKVYISFDIDGLDPKLCPATGTPVGGGLEMYEAFYLIKEIVKSGRTIIGADLCEVSPDLVSDWDANVGARVLYKLCNLIGASNKLAALQG